MADGGEECSCAGCSHCSSLQLRTEMLYILEEEESAVDKQLSQVAGLLDPVLMFAGKHGPRSAVWL